MPRGDMQVISAQEIDALLDYPSLIAILDGSALTVRRTAAAIEDLAAAELALERAAI